MKRTSLLASLTLLFGALLVLSGCTGDPLVEGAKVDLKNKNYEKALDNLNSALAEDPTNAEAWRYKGTVLQTMLAEKQDIAADQREAYVNEMIEAFVKTKELDPARGPLVDLDMQRAWTVEQRAGIEGFNAGTPEGYDRAAAAFSNATLIAPDSVSSFINLGRALYLNERYEDAIVPFERVVELGDDDADNYLLLAQIYLTLERTDEAVRVLSAAREIYPDDMNLVAQLLNTFLVTDQIDQGIALAKELVENDPEGYAANYTYGTLLLQTDQFDEAISYLTKAVNADGSNADALYNLGAAYNNKAKLLTDRINEMNEMDDPDDEAMEQLAEERRELFRLAIPHLVRAREIKEADGQATYDICRSLGQAYTFTNQTDKAEEAFACAEG